LEARKKGENVLNPDAARSLPQEGPERGGKKRQIGKKEKVSSQAGKIKGKDLAQKKKRMGGKSLGE